MRPGIPYDPEAFLRVQKDGECISSPASDYFNAVARSCSQAMSGFAGEKV